jgi:DNA-binding MarR family transcriptional regulator
MSRRRTNENVLREKAVPRAGRFSYEGLDRVMHEKARLGILASLAANAGGLLFNDLKHMCSLTDGNLNRHLAVLSDAGLVEIWKGTTGSRSQTMYRLTADGRRRFAEYINVLEKVVADALDDGRADARQHRVSGAWSTA